MAAPAKRDLNELAHHPDYNVKVQMDAPGDRLRLRSTGGSRISSPSWRYSRRWAS